MLIRTLAAVASVAALTACSTPAVAVGSMVDINVIDRVTGETLPMYWHDGRWWVPGKPGNRYAVSLTNRSGGRTLNVIAVDGVNVVSGETAAHDQTGYVLSDGQAAQITGWRKNLARVAAFEFTALSNSYAARTGRPDNVGVIGVAVFREKVRYVPPPVSAAPPLIALESGSAAGFGARRRRGTRSEPFRFQRCLCRNRAFRAQRSATAWHRPWAQRICADTARGIRACAVDA